MAANQTRAPKQIGEFGEGLVTYALIQKGYEVAYVDHVGADLIAEKKGERFAISVKTRLFKARSKESKVFVIENSYLDKLEYFSQQFGMTPIFALVVNIVDEQKIHLLMMKVDNIKSTLPEVTHGFTIRFSEKNRQVLLEMSMIDYSCWIQEKLGNKDF